MFITISQKLAHSLKLNRITCYFSLFSAKYKHVAICYILKCCLTEAVNLLILILLFVDYYHNLKSTCSKCSTSSLLSAIKRSRIYRAFCKIKILFLSCMLQLQGNSSSHIYCSVYFITKFTFQAFVALASMPSSAVNLQSRQVFCWCCNIMCSCLVADLGTTCLMTCMSRACCDLFFSSATSSSLNAQQRRWRSRPDLGFLFHILSSH